MLMIGVGTSGCRIASRIAGDFDGSIRNLLCDTDATTGQLDGDFVLLGGNRLSGRGSGGDIVAARMAVEESIAALDPELEGVRIAVIVTSLGGGTGGGATLEILKRLSQRNIPSIVFATTPFAFEGDDRQRKARSVMGMIEDAASTSFFLPLDRLTVASDNMKQAFDQAVSTLAQGITLFWRLLKTPGYIRLDAERLRHVLSRAGRGRFAAVEASGPDRAARALDALLTNESLSSGTTTIRAILCGVLAGDDLRLTEISTLANGIRKAFGETAQFELATVNDEATFSGRISAVVMLFEFSKVDESATKARKIQSVLAPGAKSRGRFQNSESTLWHGENMDEPTYLRKSISLDL